MQPEGFKSAKKRTAPRDNLRSAKSLKTTSETDEVEVVCRLTPYKDVYPCLLPLDDKTLKCVPPPDIRKRDGTIYPDKAYNFGYVFDASDSQERIFKRCAVDLISDLVEGKDGLFFTYGVTGSGKTYTMTGKPTPEETGILPRTLDVLFNSIENKSQKCVFYPLGRNTYGINPKLVAYIKRKQNETDRLQISTEVEQRFMERLKVPGYCDDYTCTVFVSYIEIYNNYCYDLLDDSLTKREIRVTQECSYVEGAKEIEVESSDEALEIFCRGEERRRKSETLLNKESSRSHSIFSIRLVMAPIKESHSLYPSEDPKKIITSQLCLVDLAGSERAKRTHNVGSRLAEAGNINKSLMCLRRCMETLRKNQRGATSESVPYRDAKLTLLFKNYFEGGGKIRMIICANPKPDDYEENLNVLSFAEESQAVKVIKQNARSQIDENRPPVPRRFYAKWASDLGLENIANENVPNINNPPINIAGPNDNMFTIRWKNYFNKMRNGEAMHDGNQTNNERLTFNSALQNALCYGDYMATQCGEMKEQQEKDTHWISELNQQIKQLKKELRSMSDRLRCYEEDEDV